MINSICGIDCTKCQLKDTCSGCSKTNGQPFGDECVIAKCSHSKGQTTCSSCISTTCNLKEQLISEFNALGIKDMENITDLNALKGSFINLDFTFPNGQVVKLLDDNKIYLGNQICKKNSNKCYGLASDGKFLLVCEYGIGGSNAEIIAFIKR